MCDLDRFSETWSHLKFKLAIYFSALYVLLEALLPVCMNYTAQDENWLENIARDEAECYVCHASAMFVIRLSSRTVYFVLSTHLLQLKP